MLKKVLKTLTSISWLSHFICCDSRLYLSPNRNNICAFSSFMLGIEMKNMLISSSKLITKAEKTFLLKML